MSRRADRQPPVMGTIEARSGKFWAYYTRRSARHTAGVMFSTWDAARSWLAAEHRLIELGTWTPPGERRDAEQAAEVVDSLTFATFAADWITNRTTASGGKLAPKTEREYRSYLAGRLAELGNRPLASINRTDMDDWWQANADRKTARHAAYMFAKSVFKDAVSRDLIAVNPCQVVNAARRVKVVPKQLRSQLVTGLEPSDLDALMAAYDRPEFAASLWLVAYLGLRPSEALALKRADIRPGTDATGLARWTVSAHNAVTTGEGGVNRDLGPTKTADSIRLLPVPPHLVPILQDHLDAHAEPGDDGLLFPSSHAGQRFATLRQVQGNPETVRTDKTPSGRRRRSTGRAASGWYAARAVIDRPTLRVYDLRHWARRMWTLTGLDFASVELLLGHTLPAVQGAYAHLDLDHVWPYAVKLSELTGWTRPDAPKPANPLDAITTEQLLALLAERMKQ